MAREKAHRRRSRSAVRRAWLYCLLMALPTFLFAGILIFRAQITPGLDLLVTELAGLRVDRVELRQAHAVDRVILVEQNDARRGFA